MLAARDNNSIARTTTANVEDWRWGTIFSHAFLLVLKHFSLIASGSWCTRTSPWKNCNHLVHCICSVHQLGHKFIFHTHMRANLQYLRYLCLQRELRLLFISVEIQLLHVYCASFDSSLLFYSILVYHIFFYFFLFFDFPRCSFIHIYVFSLACCFRYSYCLFIKRRNVIYPLAFTEVYSLFDSWLCAWCENALLSSTPYLFIAVDFFWKNHIHPTKLSLRECEWFII